MFDVRQCYRKWFLFVLSILQTDYYLTHVPLVSHIYASVNWVSIVQVKACCLLAPRHYLNHCRLIVNCAIRNRLHWNLIGIQSFSFKNMCLKISQRNFRSGDLLIYITSWLISYVWYVMQAKVLMTSFRAQKLTVSVTEYDITFCPLLRPAAGCAIYL